MSGKEILMHFPNPDVLWVLVPKTRGDGFLRQPIGENANKLWKFIDEETGLDATGLYGNLAFNRIGNKKPEDLLAITTLVGDCLTQHLGFPYRVVEHAEYWDNHPFGVV